MNTETLHATIQSVEAWREPEGGWSVNDIISRDEHVPIPEHVYASNRKLLAFMRDNGYLTPYSKGKVAIDRIPDDRESAMICNRNDGKYLFEIIPEL